MSKGKSKLPRHKPLAVVPDIIPAFDEMDTADPRTCAIVGLAFVENNLVLCLKNRFVDIDDTAQRELFDEPRALLISFSAKVEIGYLLNIYGARAREDLLLLARIRNRFAHHLEIRGFDHPEVAKLCDRIAYHGIMVLTKPNERREVFSSTASHFIHRFALEASHKYSPPQSNVRMDADY